MGREINGLRQRSAGAAFLICCGLALTAPASAESAAVPALEILWQAKDKAANEHSAALEWRVFDNMGHPLVSERLGEQAANAGQTRQSSGPFAQNAPLGSLWKLFVYLWLVEEGHPAPDYVCTATPGKQGAAARKHREEGAYCCDPGQSIDREEGLVRSCGLFFDPQRLGISSPDWRAFWSGRPGIAATAPWLPDLGAMKPETVVSPAAILSALAAAPARAREKAASVLLARLFTAAPPGLETTELIRGMGGQLRVKTFSWHRSGQAPGQAAASSLPCGGGAGWLADGRPVWFAGVGTGQQVMARYGEYLAEALAGELAGAPPGAGSAAPGCVRVNFFARYPFELERQGGQDVQDGVLQGRFVARFASGVAIPFASSGELTLSHREGRARIEGRFDLDDYVARVIDREADARQTEAARALAVVIRTYLLSEAVTQGNCLVIDDSSRKQRVSILSPSPAARAAAAFTSGLVLHGAPAGFHQSLAAKNRMAWSDAVVAGKNGASWDIILRQALPASDLGAMNDPAGLACRRFAEAEAWLSERSSRWQRVLYQHLPGFAAPEPPDVCLLDYGAPFSEQDRGRIHIRGLRSLEDRVTLAHEYLHLGLSHHPSARDEALVEYWARKLITEPLP
ncbi:MAG: DUF2300 domain-containing protein [Azonexus sp.]|jgi:uncharacterized protein YfaQ (DUF2300 family)|nr:DUF2300 domain-containing protein [Azonexus sp.]